MPKDERTFRELNPEEQADFLAGLEHVFIGPTWRRGKTGKGFAIPRHTLGWQIAEWCAEYLNASGGGPWRFTQEQLRFVLWWYALDDRGEFLFRRGVLQRLKGWGKDPLLAVLCCVEFAGPSRFAGWNAAGQPVGVRVAEPWVQVTAVNQSQTENTMSMLPTLMSDKFIAEYGIKPGAVKIRGRKGSHQIQAVTSSYRAIEGKRTTFTLLNETHHWVANNNGHKMYETITGNAAKMDSRYLAITNAFLPGEDSVAERMRDNYNKIVEGRAVDNGFLYDSIEAHPSTPLDPSALRVVIPIIRGDAYWLSIESLISEVQNISIEPARSRRMYLNQIVAEEDALYGPGEWDPLERVDLRLRPGDEITLGFDGGKTDDATALVAYRLADDACFALGCWERPEGWPTGPDAPRWQVDPEDVDSRVHEVMAAYGVRAFYADVALWETRIEEWEVQYGEQLGIKASERSAIGWDMRQNLKKITYAHERLVNRVLAKGLVHDGNKTLRRHVLNARRKVNNFGVSFSKESRESTRKVDLYAALMLAHEAAHDYRTRGKAPKPAPTGRLFMF